MYGLCPLLASNKDRWGCTMISLTNTICQLMLIIYWAQMCCPIDCICAHDLCQTCTIPYLFKSIHIPLSTKHITNILAKIKSFHCGATLWWREQGLESLLWGYQFCNWRTEEFYKRIGIYINSLILTLSAVAVVNSNIYCSFHLLLIFLFQFLMVT